MRRSWPAFACLLVLTGTVYADAGILPLSMSLQPAFGTRSPWRLTGRQGPQVDGANTPSGADEPGRVDLCLSNDGGRRCRPVLDHPLALSAGTRDEFGDAHSLEAARVVEPVPGRPLLLLRLASQHSGDNDQRVGTMLFRYDRATDRFAVAYRATVNRNRNDEIRYVASGVLKGDVISASPTDDAPFGYWITVDSLGAQTYRSILRYRSATHYQDGNPLAVIDSEMPNIERRLGLWRAGRPLPLPAGRCAQPHLVRKELWCGAPIPYR